MTEEHKPSKAEKEKLADLLRAKIAERRANMLRDFEPYPVQRDVIAATLDHTEVAVRMGNQQGKSYCMSAICSAFATGIYPDDWPGRKFDKPTRGWIVGESMQAVRDVAQKYLIGDSTEPGFIPPDRIGKVTLGHGPGGGIDVLEIRHLSGGISRIGFKSYEQGREKLQGETLDWCWTDEEPPMEAYYECLARLIKTNGLMLVSFTPLHGSNRIVPRFAEHSAEALAARKMIHGTIDDALHLKDPARRAALLATFPEHQRKARIQGLPLYGSGHVFPGVEWEHIQSPLTYRDGRIIHAQIGELETRGIPWLWAIDFGIDHPFAAVLLAYEADPDRIHVVAEVRVRGGTPFEHAARIRALSRNLGDVRVAWPHDGNNREKSSGEALIQHYRDAGLHVLSQHATHVRVGGFDFEAGIQEMDTRFREGRLLVSPRCQEWRGEFEVYHRKDGRVVKEDDDLMSATRIGVMQIRSAQTTTGQNARQLAAGSGGGATVCSGLDFDPFTGR
jgi:phage terminase large subunit-like protein